MSPAVKRRKLQKKAKRKRYRKCPKCEGRTVCRVMTRFNFDPRQDVDDDYVLVQQCETTRLMCGFRQEIK